MIDVRERIIIAIVFMVLALPMMFVKSSQWVEGYADQALFSEVTENIAHTGVPLSRLHLFIQAMIRRIIGMARYWIVSTRFCALPSRSSGKGSIRC